MNQINSFVNCDVTRLQTRLKTWYAKVAHNFVARLRHVPEDVYGVYVRIFKKNNAYNDVVAIEHSDGEYSVRVPAFYFTDAGLFHYEVHGYSAEGEPCAIGEGRIIVDEFSTTTDIVEGEGSVQNVVQLPCEGGGYVQVIMKWDGFAWVPEAIYNAQVNEGDENE